MSNVHDPTVEVLLEIRDSMLRLEAGQAEMSARLDQVIGRLDQTNARLGDLVGLSECRRRGHEDRIARLEERVKRVEGRVGS